MGDAPMVFQVGCTILEARHQVEVRRIGAQNQGKRGKARLAVEPRVADGDRGKGVSQIIHARGRKSKNETRNLSRGTRIVAEMPGKFRFSTCQLRIRARG